MEFHIGILPRQSARHSLSTARAAEELGFSGVWIADSHSIMRDPYALLSVLAVQTKRIVLATGVTPTGTRHPAVIANSWATLHELSGGRAVLGIGTGDSAVANLGMRPEKLALFEEKIRVIRGLMRGEEMEYEGQTLRMPWANVEVPVVVACSGPKALELAGRVADGVLFQVGARREFVSYALEHIRRGAESAGRRPDDLRLYMRLACAVSEDRQKARDEVRGYASVAAGTVFRTIPREHFDDDLWRDVQQFKAAYDYLDHGSSRSRQAALVTEPMLDAIGVAGTPDEVVEKLRALAALGIDGFVCPVGMDDAIPYLRMLARRVVPEVAA